MVSQSTGRYSDAKVANRNVWGFGVGDRSHGAGFPRHDSTRTGLVLTCARTPRKVRTYPSFKDCSLPPRAKPQRHDSQLFSIALGRRAVAKLFCGAGRGSATAGRTGYIGPYSPIFLRPKPYLLPAQQAVLLPSQAAAQRLPIRPGWAAAPFSLLGARRSQADPLEPKPTPAVRSTSSRARQRQVSPYRRCGVLAPAP